jgi:hypothetical protein
VQCGEALPWATREQLIGRLTSYFDFENELTAANRLVVKEQIDALSILEAEDAPETRGYGCSR